MRRLALGLAMGALAALALAATAPAAHAQRVADRLDDLRLATAVRLALVDDARTRALDLDVAARDGGVEVSGSVPAAERLLVAEVARSVPGVRVLGGLGAAADRAAPTPIQQRPADPPRAAGPPTVGPPTVEPPASATGDRLYHTVERGDTLFSLARRYGTSVEAIRALNGRQSDGIRVGQRLRVR